MRNLGHVAGVLLLFLSLCSPAVTYGLGAPFGLNSRSVSKYRADLFWFYAGVNDTVVKFDDGTWAVPTAVSESDRDNRMAVKFILPELPVCIESVSILILDQDTEPSQPGTPYSPLEISLREDDNGLPGNCMSEAVAVQASGDWVDGGEWVHAAFRYAVTADTAVWAQIRWPAANPFMPKIGADSPSSEQIAYIGYHEGESDAWLRFSDYSLMVRIELLRNTKADPITESESALDSFRVYCRDRLPIYPDPTNHDTSTSGSMLHQRVHVDGMDNYFCVTAFDDGLESPASGTIHMAGAGGPTAPVTIRPRNMFVSVLPGQDTTVFISMKNNGLTVVHYEYFGTALFSKAEIGLPIVINDGSGLLYPGETDSITLQILSSTLPLGTFIESGELRFIDSIEVYLPEDVAIQLTVDEHASAYDDCVETRPADSDQLICYPNPFNSGTRITARRASRAADPEVTVIDVLGRRVAALRPLESDGELLIYFWSGQDLSGRACPTGIYFGRLSCGKSQSVKMLLLR
jgi:hypothetical protein